MADGRAKEAGRVFRTEVKVRFFEADPAGVLFFARFFAKAHEVLEEFVTAAGIPWEDWFGGKETLVPLKKVEADYKRPLRPGEIVPAELSVLELGRSKVVFLVRFLGEGGPACLVRMTGVFVRARDMRPVSIPPAIREKLEPYLAGGDGGGATGP
ncbi:MAG TPA: acyl-CoA thioesterase [Planctomycetes bacterium]|nr:acyl-CoA thioesterase [Planctomycetota bacterium]